MSLDRQTAPLQRGNSRFWSALMLVIGLVVMAITPLVGLSPANAAPGNYLSIDKDVDVSELVPGQSFTYTITVRCSEEDCINAQVRDPLPSELAGFAIQNVTFNPGPIPKDVTWLPGGTSTPPAKVGTDTVLVVDLKQATDGGNIGLQYGQDYRITVSLQVPADYPPGNSGDIVNVAAATADNANRVEDDATVVIDSAVVMGVAVDKTWAPANQSFNPGADSTIGLSARNSSNVDIDSLSIQEPKAAPDGAADLDASNPFTITDFTGFDAVNLPAACTTVRVDAYVRSGGTWSWVQGAPVPAPAVALPAGVANGDVGGVRITCLGTIPPGQSLTFDLDVEQRATHRNTSADLSTDPHSVDNVTTGEATLAGQDPATDDGNASFAIAPAIPTVEAAKDITPDTVTAGQSATATLGATNGAIPVSELRLADLGFFTADVTFGGFDSAPVWPAGATAGVLTYHLLAGGTQVVPLAVGVVPAAPSGKISGFEIVWTGDTIDSDETGSVEFGIDTTEDATGPSSTITLTNTVDVEVTAPNGLTDADDASAQLRIINPEIAVTLTKSVRPSTAVNPGESVIASLKAHATVLGAGTELTDIVVEDVWGNDATGFWNAFNLTSIVPTQVPPNTTLTVEVFDGTAWHQLALQAATPAATVFTMDADALTAELTGLGLNANTVSGVRFSFNNVDGFPTDTNVTPNLEFEARSTKRDGSGPITPAADQEVGYVNTASVEADGESAGGKPLHDSDGDIGTGTVVTPPGGPGPGVSIEKTWVEAAVDAQSSQSARTHLDFNVTKGLNPVVIADQPGAPSVAGVGSTVFDAFNLTAIEAVATNSVPYSTGWYLLYDSVTKVELHNGTSWQEVTAPGGTWMTGVRGFKGYTLTAPEQASTIAVRITLGETAADTAARQAARQPGANLDPYAPAPNSGVGYGSADRRFTLGWQVRDKARSDDRFVTEDATYNHADEGTVVNTVGVTGTRIVGGATVTDTDSDTILILDPDPLVSIDKSVTPTTGLFTPPVGTAAGSYPTATWSMTAKNASTAKATYVRVTDPATCTDTALADCQTSAAPESGAYTGVVDGAVGDPFDTSVNYLTDPAVGSPFNRFDATGITIAASIANQVDLTKTTVWLLRYAGGTYTTEQSTATAVNAMTAAQLADVVGFSVAFQGGDPSQGGTITQSNDLTVTVASRMRATLRVEGTNQVLRAGQTLDVTNRAFAQSYDPVTSPNVVTGDADDAVTQLTGGQVNIAPTKTITPAQLNEPQRGNTVNVVIGANQGSNPRSTLSPQSVVIEDQADSVDFWNNFDFTGLGTVTLPSGADRVRVDLYDGTSWVNGTAAATAALPTGVALGDVQGIRLTFTRANGAYFSSTVPAPNWAASAAFTVVARDTLRDSGDPLVFAGQRIDNTQTSSSTRTDGNNSGEVDASDDIVLSKGTQEIAVNKLTNEGNRLNNVGSAVPFDLTIKNVGTGYLTVTELVDDLPAELLYLEDPAPIYTAAPSGTLSEDVTATPSADGTSVTFTWPEGGQRMLPNETFKIRVFLELQPGLSMGQTAVNTMTVRTEEELTGCRNVQTGGNLTGAWDADKTTCGTTDYVGVVNGPNLYTAKGVRGSLDGAYLPGKPSFVCSPRMTATPGDAVATDGKFYRPQCVANSQVGGTDDWVLNNVNSGTTPIADMIIFDQLPVAGDQLLVSGASRGSEFRPRLVADSLKVTGPPGTAQIVEVTSSANVCRDTWTNIRNQQPCEQNGEVWEAVSPTTDWASVSGFRVKLSFADTASGNLAPGQKVDINYSTINELVDDEDASGASRVVPADDQLAYNQHGIKYRFTGQAQWRELAPSKVGVHLRTGAIGIEKTVTGPAKAYAPTEFLANVTCRIDDAELDLGTDAVVELNAAGNYEARIDGIPLSVAGTECTVSEKGSTGEFGESSRTGSPTTLQVDEEIAPSDDLDAASIVSLGNDYQFTSLSVQKLVDTAAVDTTFGPFSFELSCLSILGDRVKFADDADELEFDLAAGATWTSPTDRIPVGAECTLTETDNYLADQIVIVGDNVVDEGAGVAKVTPGLDPAEVVVTNGFDAGTVTINKVVDGAGAARWGTASFGFDVTCTYQEQTPFDGSFTLRAGDSKTLGPYPAGTECAVKEVATGGATTSVLDPADGIVTVASPVAPETISQATVTATNTFALTSLDVVKERVGALDVKGANGPFKVSLACTWLVDGKRVGFDIPGGAERTLAKRNSYRASYNNLPSSAQCVLTETEDGGAKRTTIEAEVAGKTLKSKKATIALDLSKTAGPGEASATVTNEFAADVSDGGDENDNGALNDGENNLPGVGSPVTMWLLATGLLLLLGGAVLLIARRRGGASSS
ncbi:DUF5979 domain-containing protein [Nocardioides sp. Bht2]|uniref:DUF5979 domain-containing protein n=1 Tax=Nocardioides sp. Bht2 TaxID=3392297 RepID=UPI0039B4E1BC